MKKILLSMAIAAMGLTGCGTEPQSQALEINNALTPQEIQGGRLTPEVMWKMRRAGSAVLSPDAQKLVYTLTDYSMEENRGITTIWLKDMASGKEVALTDYSSNNSSPAWSADGQKIRFISSRSGSAQVWEMDLEGKNVRQLTKFDKDVEGFGINSTEDKAWYAMRVHAADHRSADVHKDMPKSKARIYDDLMVRHWNYWDMGEYLHIFVGDMNAQGIAAGKDIIGEDAAWDAPLAPYFDMGEIAWSNNGKLLAYTCKPLKGKAYAVSTDSDIFVYNPENGETRNICKPEGKTDNLPGYDKYPVWSPNDEMIAFASQRRAGNEADKSRLFVYDVKTAEMKDLTTDFDYNSQNVIWADNDQIYFIAPIHATHQICRVKASDAEVEVLTKGDHDINHFTMVEGKIVAEMQSIKRATELYTVNAEGELTQITDVNKEVYDNIKMGEVEKRWVKTTDGKEMLTWVILPPDFDASKKYPVLLYCQGGPQSVVSQFWSYRWNFQVMAAKGYIVVAPNRRGLPSFGQEWLDQISGDYSGQNIEDYLAAIDDVAKEPWADEDRMGCVGASYGGYSTYYLAGHHNKRFKAFIAHCGIFNFESMYGETEELFFLINDYGGAYFDKDNAVAMRSYANSPHKSVDKWDTPILIFTGEYDYRIPYTQSLQAFTAAKMRGLDARLVSFEDEAHQVFKPQNSLVWQREFFGWLDKYLK